MTYNSKSIKEESVEETKLPRTVVPLNVSLDFVGSESDWGVSFGKRRGYLTSEVGKFDILVSQLFHKTKRAERFQAPIHKLQTLIVNVASYSVSNLINNS